MMNKDMTPDERILFMQTFDSRYRMMKECVKQLSRASSVAEYAMIFDINGFMDDENIPQCFKKMRERIG